MVVDALISIIAGIRAIAWVTKAILVTDTISATHRGTAVIAKMINLIRFLQRRDVRQIALRFTSPCLHHELLITRQRQRYQDTDDADRYHQFYQTKCGFFVHSHPYWQNMKLYLAKGIDRFFFALVLFGICKNFDRLDAEFSSD